MRELILGGQKSGKSAYAERRAAAWLAASPEHGVLLLATAQGHDAEMRARIARHQLDRAERVPGVQSLEVPLQLAAAITAHSTPSNLLIVDCLTLWLTNHLMPYCATDVTDKTSVTDNNAAIKSAVAPFPIEKVAALTVAIKEARGPVVLVSNEIGLGVIPMGREVREFVDALGQLNQAVAHACDRVGFMAAGIRLSLKAPG